MSPANQSPLTALFHFITAADGDERRLILALRCRDCAAETPGADYRADVAICRHASPCRVPAVVERWQREGWSPETVDEYDALCRALDAAEAATKETHDEHD
jgi:hypothetical protein